MGEREGKQRASGWSSYPHSSARRQLVRQRRAGGMATVNVRSVATEEDDDDVFLNNPLAKKKSITTWSSSSLVNLIEALNHFYKFYKNSCGLSISSRSSTKIGAAK